MALDKITNLEAQVKALTIRIGELSEQLEAHQAKCLTDYMEGLDGRSALRNEIRNVDHTLDYCSKFFASRVTEARDRLTAIETYLFKKFGTTEEIDGFFSRPKDPVPPETPDGT